MLDFKCWILYAVKMSHPKLFISRIFLSSSVRFLWFHRNAVEVRIQQLSSTNSVFGFSEKSSFQPRRKKNSLLENKKKTILGHRDGDFSCLPHTQKYTIYFDFILTFFSSK